MEIAPVMTATEEPLGDEHVHSGEPAGDEGLDSAPASAGESGPLDLEPELSDEELERHVFALLFAASEPLGLDRLAKLCDEPASERVRAALERLALRLDRSGLPIVLKPIALGWRLLSDPALGDVVVRLSQSPRPDRISAAALETLAIVAYRQPVTKAEVDAIRGVQSGPMLRTLVDRGLARVTGRADQPGSPLQYGTTKEFLDRFGLASLEDLPRDGELASGS
jgi:segregation and condensation protein B